MGRELTVTAPELDAEFFPKSDTPVSLCIEGPPSRQCYTAPKEFVRFPEVTVVQLAKDTPGLLFSAATVGVSGFAVHFALLRAGQGPNLEDCFLSAISISSQSEHALWKLPAVSDAPIFATADYVQGPDESHISEHRYIISTYARRPSTLVDGLYYYLEDQYMTVRKYSEGAHILNSEKPEILARLKRVKAAHPSPRRTP